MTVFWAAIVVLLFSGCGTAPPTGPSTGDSGTFRGRWWNHYQRALDHGNAGRLDQALADLNQALGQRDQDQRMARTYGMHFIDYFPHRERGLVYLQTGDLDAARQELELSITQFPSAKALFYLDKVRKAILERQAVTVSEPRLTLDMSHAPLWTAADPVLIAGEAADPHFIAAITVHGKPVFMEGSQPKVRFSENLTLSDGRHEVHVEAVNLMGKAATRPVVIHVDRQGPVIAVEAVTAGPSGKAILSAWVHDDAGIASASLDGNLLAIQPANEVQIRHELPAGKNQVRLRCTDRLGNTTEANIPVAAKTLARTSHLLAAMESDLLGAGLFGPKDEHPPLIQIKDWAQTQTVVLDKIHLDGTVSDDIEVAGLTINGQSMLRRKGRHVVFNHQALLAEGANAFTIVARDGTGKTAVQKITVIRSIPAAFQIKERLSLAVLPFDHKGRITEASMPFQDNLTGALANRNRFNMIERAKLEAVLREQNLSATRLVDPETAVKAGRLMAAGALVAGTIVESATGIEIAARVVDTETSVLLAAVDTYDEVKGLGQAGVLAEGLALKIHRAFPLVDGRVVQKNGPAITTDLGQGKAALNRRFIVFRQEEIKLPKSGKVVKGDAQVIGKARVTQVMADVSKADLVTCKPEDVEIEDMVVTE